MLSLGYLTPIVLWVSTMRFLVGAVAGVVATIGAASAGTIYEYTNTNIHQRADAGTIESLSFAYDTDERLSFQARLSSTISNVAWFVLSPGPMPRTTDDELAILYLDYAGGDVYAYRYNGDMNSWNNGRNSFRDPSRFITAYNDILSVDTTGGELNVSFDDLDVSALAPGAFGTQWTGVSFSDMIGVWAHFTAADIFCVGNGMISEFRPTIQSWYDTENQPTGVPEPAGLAALGMLGMIGIAVARRRRASA